MFLYLFEHFHTITVANLATSLYQYHIHVTRKYLFLALHISNYNVNTPVIWQLSNMHFGCSGPEQPKLDASHQPKFVTQTNETHMYWILRHPPRFR